MHYLSFHNQITIFWLFDKSIKDGVYQIYLDKILVGETPNNSYTFYGLKSNEAYHISVKCEGKAMFDEIIKTKPKKNIIYVDADNSGKKLVTKELQNIIDTASKEDVIYFPKGIYLTGALFLHDHTEIYLEEGATIQGSDDFHDYLPKIKSRFEGHENESYASLINIGYIDDRKTIHASDVFIHGKGSIYGGGQTLCESIIEEEKKHLEGTAKEIYEGMDNLNIIAGRKRNRLFNISQAEGVVIEGLRLGRSASWNIHPIYSRNIYIYNCLIESYGLHNGDGIDPDSSSFVYIFNDVFDVGDDCIAIKSGKNPEGNIINIPTHDVYIFDCYSMAGHGCSIGSEISGGIQNIDIFHTDFINTYHGLQLKTTAKRGGYIKNVRVKDSSFASINIHTVSYNDDGEGAKELTKVSGINIQNVTLKGITCHKTKESVPCDYIKIAGFEESPSSFSDITIQDCKIIRNEFDKKTSVVKDAENVVIEDIKHI